VRALCDSGPRIQPHAGVRACRSLTFAEAVRTLARRCPLDGVFLSCTNLRTLDILAPLQAELGLPVLSSNQVLALQMARLAGVKLVSRDQIKYL